MSDFKTSVKNIFKEIYYFLSSSIFLKNLAGMVFTFIGVLALSFWWMTCYTHHGESLQVPNFEGIDINTAIQKAKQHDLKVVINDSTWLEDVKPGTVIEQNPVNTSRVKKDRTIYLTIRNYKAQKKILPVLAGNDNYNMYHRRLKKLKINLKVKDKQFNNKLEENTILHLYIDEVKVTAEDLKAGVEVPQGAIVQAVVTTRGGGRVYVPDLVCKKYSEAEFIIGGSQLSVSVIKDGTVKTLDNAYVWKQSPAYSSGKTLGVGTIIDVYVTKRPPVDCD